MWQGGWGVQINPPALSNWPNEIERSETDGVSDISDVYRSPALMSNKLLTITNTTAFTMVASDRNVIWQSVESRQRGTLPLGGQGLTT